MTSRQDSYLTMYEMVEDFLNIHIGVTTTIPNSALFLTVIHNIIQQIHYNASQQIYDITGTAIAKKQLRTGLEGQGLDIALKTVAYATFVEDNELLKKAKKFSKSALRNGSDNFLIDSCGDIYALANAHVAALATYGVTPAMLTNFQANTNAYADIVHNPGMGIEDRKIFTNNLKELFTQGNIAMKKADAAVEVVRLTQPDFYEEYKSIRKVTDTSVRHLSLKGLAVDKATGDPMEGVTFVFAHEEGLPAGRITKLTAAHGGFLIRSMPTGMYTVKVTMTDYKPQTLTVPVNNVTMMKLIVEMEEV